MDGRWKHEERPVSQCQGTSFLYWWREEVQESADAAPTWMSPPGPFPACTEHRKPPCASVCVCTAPGAAARGLRGHPEQNRSLRSRCRCRSQRCVVSMRSCLGWVNAVLGSQFFPNFSQNFCLVKQQKARLQSLMHFLMVEGEEAACGELEQSGRLAPGAVGSSAGQSSRQEPLRHPDLLGSAWAGASLPGCLFRQAATCSIP